jgi:SAM-dependent methyltransferase
MEFTGERYVPGTPGLEDLYIEHMSRYAFASDIARGRKVLDVGCGTGYGTHLMALRGAELAVGIDISPEAIDFARGRYQHSQLRYAVMNANHLGLAQEFDLVTAFEVIEHVEDAPGLLNEIKGIISDTAVLLVSTPNRITYLAGGPEGKNPFHTREYDIMEFTELLGSVFPYVRIFGQSWVEGITLVPHPGLLKATTFRTGKLPHENGSLPYRLFSCEPPYFVGVCAKRDIVRSTCSKLTPVVIHSIAPRFERLKQAMGQLQHRFDERGTWALSIEAELHKRDGIIEGLQRELRDLRAQFDDRGRWAKSLDGQLQAKELQVKRLTQENQELRQMLEPV